MSEAFNVSLLVSVQVTMQSTKFLWRTWSAATSEMYCYHNTKIFKLEPLHFK